MTFCATGRHQFSIRSSYLSLADRAITSRGAITKAGNGRARRLLIESAWTYRLPARIASELLARSAAFPEAVKAIAWKAQVRLCARYRRLRCTGKPTNVRIPVNVISHSG